MSSNPSPESVASGNTADPGVAPRQMVHRDCDRAHRSHSQLRGLWVLARRQEVRQGLWGLE